MKIYNTITNTKEEFIPVEPQKVKMYVCGPTVYNYFHIGNARPFLFFDVVRRYFEYSGYEVLYVQNITDIDDKIINKANKENVPYSQITSKYIEAYYEDIHSLGIQRVSIQPKATEFIQEMIDLINSLVNNNIAYEKNGNVYFSIQAYKDYGHISGKNIESLIAGARIEENVEKRNPLDFTLWKKAKPGEPSWNSPWGQGRPGWHTECVVMSRRYLGDTFDIHGGGIDLVFPHHENESAQACAISNKPLAHYWMHNGFLNINGEKMSKSLDNFFTVRDILQKYDAEAIRFFFLSKHYRTPIDFNEDIMKESQVGVKNFYDALKSVHYLDFQNDKPVYSDEETDIINRFTEAMDDDFNTARAIAILFECVRVVRNESNTNEQRLLYAHLLVELGSVLGFFAHLNESLKETLDNVASDLIQLFIHYRSNAKKDKNYLLADQIRNDLMALGIELKDTPQGTIWNKI